MVAKDSHNELIIKSLQEDVGGGDITTRATIRSSYKGEARIISKQEGILAGSVVCAHVFSSIDRDLKVKISCFDGNPIKPNDTVILIAGSIGSIVTAERTALNYLAHLSGVATLTAQFVKQIKGTRAKITDTRKTLPFLRALEKEAVKAGGGYNHRMGLYDMILIKENHITAVGGIVRAVEQTQRFLDKMGLDTNIEVETRSLDDVREALACPVTRIMLDNMTLDEMRQAVKLINHQVEVEASGNVNLENVREIALCGVDYISVGAITHSAPAFDFSLIVNEVNRAE